MDCDENRYVYEREDNKAEIGVHCSSFHGR